MCTAGRGRSAGRATRLSWLFPRVRNVVVLLDGLRSETQVVDEDADQAASHRKVAEPLEGFFPQPDRPRNVRIPRQAAVRLRIGGVVQDAHGVRAAGARP